MVVLAVRAVPPLVPLPEMVMGKEPAATVLATETVTTLLVVAGLVPKDTVTPAGAPEARNATAPVNPPESATVIVSVALLPAATVKEAAEGVNVNEGLPMVPPLPPSGNCMAANIDCFCALAGVAV